MNVEWICDGLAMDNGLDLQRICNGSALDSHWMAVDLHSIRIGFALDVEWICNGFILFL